MRAGIVCIAVAAICVGMAQAYLPAPIAPDENVPLSGGSSSSISKAASSTDSAFTFTDTYTYAFVDDYTDHSVESYADAYADAYSYDGYSYADADSESYSETYADSYGYGEGDVYTDTYTDADTDVYGYADATAAAFADADGYITVFKKYWERRNLAQLEEAVEPLISLLAADPTQDMSIDKKAAKFAGGNKAKARASKDTSGGDDDSDELEVSATLCEDPFNPYFC